MNTISRRSMLGAIPLVVLGVAGCTPGTVTPSQIASDASLIASGLGAVVASLSTIPGMNASTLTTVQTYLAQLKLDADLLAGNTAGIPTATVQDISALVGKIAAVVLPILPMGSATLPIVEAAQSLVLVLLAMAGVSAAQASRPRHLMSAVDARRTLAAASKS